MKKIYLIAGVVGLVWLLGKMGVPQHYMQHEWKDAAEKARADIKAECEKVDCWHL